MQNVKKLSVIVKEGIQVKSENVTNVTIVNNANNINNVHENEIIIK